MRVFTVQTELAAVAAAQTLLTLQNSTTRRLVILRAWMSQKDLVASELMRVQLQRTSAQGTGTAIVPVPQEVTDPAAIGTYLKDHTIEPTYILEPFNNEQFNALNGWVYVPMPEERIWLPFGGGLGLRLDTVPSGATTMTAGLVFGEVG